MGTKIQSNSYLSGYCSIWGLNDGANNDISSLYHDGKALKNGQHYDPILPQKLWMGGNLGYEKEKVRQIILEHESTFRHQLQELHRLYGRQREIMNEFKRRQVKNIKTESETSHSSGFPLHISADATKPTWHVSHTSLLHSLLDQASALQNSSLPSSRKGKTLLGPFQSKDEGSSETCEPPNNNSKLFRRRVFDLEMPADTHMNYECRTLEKSFYGLPGNENSSTTRIDQIQHNKEINHHQNGDALQSNLCIKRNHQLADLNEPVPLGEGSFSAIVGNSGNVTSTDIGCDQLRIGFKSKIISNDGARPSTRDACSKTSEAELRRDQFSTSDQGMAKQQIRKRIFGVDIFEVDDKQVVTDSSMVNCNLTNDKKAKDLVPRLSREESPPKSFKSSACLNWMSDNISKTAKKLSNISQVTVSDCNSVNAYGQSERNDSMASLLCSVGTEHSRQLTRSNKNPHHLNLDSLQYSCQQFFQKSKRTSLSSEILIQKQETSQHAVQETEQSNIAVDGGRDAEMNNCFSVSNSKELSFIGISSKEINVGAQSNNSGRAFVETAFSKHEQNAGDIVVEDRTKNSLSGFCQLIDLNLSLSEDEASSVHSLPSTVVEIARTEIDLEAPVTLQSEADNETNLASGGQQGPYDEELLKIAAEAIVAISSSTFNVVTPEPLEALCSDHLSWFVELACLYKYDDWSNASELIADGIFMEEMIPDSIDYFEFMTLRLKDTKEDNYLYNPQIIENGNELGEETIVPAQSRRPRRGQGRKGRQRKDFQRDILPALVTLSKHEVVEDFQTLEELFKSSGCEWKSSLARKAAGKSTRRRKSSNSEASTPPRENDAICYSLEQQPVSTEVQDGEKTLSGWGKRTRRLPRQRYMNGSQTFQLQP